MDNLNGDKQLIYVSNRSFLRRAPRVWKSTLESSGLLIFFFPYLFQIIHRQWTMKGV